MILAGSGEHFSPLVWIIADTEILFATSEIVNTRGTPVLASVCRVAGTGNFYYEDYFVGGGSGMPPSRLQLGEAIDRALAGLYLPEDAGVCKGGGFDLASLSYSKGVWLHGDSNCCPSGGRFNLWFEIRQGKLVVTRAKYDPN